MDKKDLVAAVKEAYKHWPLEVLPPLTSLLSPSSVCLLQEIRELNALLHSKAVDKSVDTTRLKIISPQDQESNTPLLVNPLRFELSLSLIHI